MRIERVSLRVLSIGILLILGGSSAFLSLVAGSHFREAALGSQIKSLSRVIEVAGGEVIKSLRSQVVSVGFSLQKRDEFRDSLQQLAEEGGRKRLLDVLDDPFITGFVGVADVELVKLRVFDLELQQLAESRRGSADLTQGLPPFLYTRAKPRSGADRLKAVGGLWVSPIGPLYSVLVPVGGLRVKGYLELVVQPNFNLPRVAEIIQMPLEIFNMSGTPIYQSHGSGREQFEWLPVEYVMMSDNGEPAFRLVAMENVEELNAEMYDTQLRTTFGFLSLTLASLLLALWLFNRFLFRPVENMMGQIERCTRGDLDTQIEGRSLKEFHALAKAFNGMTKKLRDSIKELQKLSSLDGLTGIANRRQFDAALENEWKRSLRGGEYEVSLILLDIDYFKQFNDTYGHQSGDDCLKRVAAALQQATQRPADLVARYGGEEFVVLLPATGTQGALNLAAQIQNEVAKLRIRHSSSDVSTCISVSLGITTLTPTAETPPFLLIGEADEALYYAKERGRNRVELSEKLRNGGASQQHG
ncbi:hypothetical protein BOW53_06200 [Solemya pervernicosa gill symbiont]|uniref:diguanylate cyclase n=2 Tax=Gammaproteobacteria incertae sedis TaxID=118884 RepID=A0A1T2L785_9GAMM|nr:diguanylate cyclase [Candidatus Reidiella endopervernicosa]OOZ40806.1 hypothetical protein BOW53_06200 [Solemya pervernicosa gill symbiont]QKQ26317.1 diguanylate cyclase [Candidatus Reidiella endopervernicosa]